MDASKAYQLHPQMTIRGRTYPVTPYYPDDNEDDDDDDDEDDEQSTPPETGPSDAVPSLSDIISPPPKRQKTEPSVDKILCKVCFQELDGAYSTPCRRCAGPRCYDCLRKEFQLALKYRDRMPVTCCQAVMHHEVARGVLSDEEIDLYKLRWDESKTVDPLYCPIPTCSTFIPPRMVKPRKSSVDCPSCGTLICTKCKQLATAQHVCSKDDARLMIVETFHYKLCPKCGTGVMKMFGCPHVRCQCGAHWCWDCQRPMTACYRRPCSGRDDGEASVVAEEDEFESGDETDRAIEEQEVPEPGASGPDMADTAQTVIDGESSGDAELRSADTAPMQHEPYLTIQVGNSGTPQMPDEGSDPPLVEPASETPSVLPSTETDDGQPRLEHIPSAVEGVEATVEATDPPTEPSASAPVESQNLDDPDDFDWEGRSMDFGDEPIDEAWDIWGCQHQLCKFEKPAIPEFWLVGLDRSDRDGIAVECMSCFEKVKVWEGKGGTSAGESGECKKAIDKSGRESSFKTRRLVKVNKSQCSYECRLCGVVYCGTCQKAAARRIQKDRAAANRD
jgi:hypothetical protein